MRICKSCGCSVDANASFCKCCGGSLENNSYFTGEVSNTNNVQSNTTSGLCIAGFVSSFFVPIVGFILSIIGLSQANQNNQNGKGLAIAGIVISVFTFIVYFIIYAAILYGDLYIAL